MPYELIKVSPRLYKVQNKDTGKFYSNKGIPRKNAVAQMRLLYMLENRGLDGGGIFNDIIEKVKAYAKQGITKVAELTSIPVRLNYPPKARKTLAIFGSYPISRIVIRRYPIQAYVDKLLDFISLGKFTELKRKYAYDKLFHLSMIVTLSTPSGSKEIIVEKNEVINISDTFISKPDMDVIDVDITPGMLTLANMMNKTAQAVGPDFFRYDAFTNNCQIFLINILRVNGLLTDPVKYFILQDVSELAKELPSFVAPVAKTLTNLGAITDRIVEGEGRDKHTEMARYLMEKRFIKKMFPDLRAEYDAKKAAGDTEFVKQAKPVLQTFYDRYETAKGKLERRFEGYGTRRENVIKKYKLEDKPYSLAALAKISGVPKSILQEVYNRGIGAYKTQPRSVRLKGSFVKNVDAPMSKKLSKEQWTMARVYSFLDGNPDHDNDLRANKGGAIDRDTYLKRQSRGIYSKDQSYEQYVAQEQAQRARIDAEVADLTESNKEYEKFIKENPDAEEVRCKIGADLEPGSEVITKAECDARHVARNRKLDEATPMGQVMKGLISVGDVLTKVIPMPGIVKQGWSMAKGMTGNGKVGKRTAKINVQPLKKRKRAALKLIRDLLSALQSGEIDIDEANEYIDDMEFSDSETEYIKAELERQWRDVALTEGMSGEETESGDEAEEATGKKETGFTGSGKPQSLVKQLKQLGISKDEYLASIREAAKRAGYDPMKVRLAQRGKYKIIVEDDSGKLHRAGASGYMDYHLYQILEKRGSEMAGSAKTHRDSYLARAKNIRGNWRKSKYSPNSLAISILWG